MKKQDRKILICGSGGEGRTTKLLAEMGETNVEIVTPKQALERGFREAREPTKIEPLIPEMPFMAPATRAERRAEERKNKRKKK